MKTAEFKAEAADRGISWDVVREHYAELREYDMRRLERTWESRAIAWKALPCGHGGKLKRKYRKAFDGGDMTMIPGFDDVAKELAATDIPELGTDNPAEALWDLIVPNKPQATPAAEIMREAMELALETVAEDVLEDCEELEAVPF